MIDLFTSEASSQIHTITVDRKFIEKLLNSLYVKYFQYDSMGELSAKEIHN